MGLLEHLGLVEAAQRAAADRRPCSRCGQQRLPSNLATVPGPFGPELTCSGEGCPEPIGPHPLLRPQPLPVWRRTPEDR